MLKGLLKKLLEKNGKDYTPDKNLSDKFILSVLATRLLMLLRGFYVLKRKIFLGKRVKIKNKRNFSFGTNCTIEKYVTIDCYAKEKLVFGDSVKIGAHSTIGVTSHMSKYGIGLKIGNNSGIGEYSFFGCSGGVVIGNDVIMGPYVSFHSENHNFSDSTKLIREQGVVSEGIKLGNNIWVGAKSTFLDGCEIGDNCVVAAGAVVKGKFPSDVVIGGVPAKVLKKK
ncbi:acyltransferase [Winogradskyella luteola]|uniref:Acyltransferase n=1 Tax=Winogradskyella luteola TaxID=2828330 RepID=A0A9X1JPX9_9FLAO|nr:acyltransferase [Winogradskyella luteola]MBV7269169.1 acyltransferase [Winogradskyella luteola]